ncbi:MAG: hypothetical protein ACYC7E_11170 [Armatimonadota bacterium]
MKTLTAIAILFALCTAGIYAAEVSVTAEAGAWRVNTGQAVFAVDKKLGALTEVGIPGGKRVIGNFFLARVYPPLSEGKATEALPEPCMQEKETVTAEMTQPEPGRAVATSAFACRLGRVEQTYTFFAGAAYAKVEVALTLTAPASEAVLACGRPSPLNLAAGRFYPRDEQWGLPYKPWLPDTNRYLLAPEYAFWLDPATGIGAGVLVPEGGDLDRISYKLCASAVNMNVPSEFALNVHFRSLYRGSRTLRGTCYVFPAVGKADGERVWQQADAAGHMARPAVQIERVYPGKLVYARNEKGVITATLRNRTEEAQTVTAKCVLVRGLDERQLAGYKTGIQVPPLGKTQVVFPFTADAREFGVQAEAVILREDRVLDRRSDPFQTLDDVGKAMFMCYSGIENGHMRENFINTIQWFNWYPEAGTLDAPLGPYKSHMASMMRNGQDIYDGIKDAHRQGLKTMFYYWLSGSGTGTLDYARNPELLVYTENGQPVRPNLYTKEFRDFLADQFLKTINKFGWDAVMIDCMDTVCGETPGAFNAYFYRTRDGKMAGEEFAPTPDAAGAKFFGELIGRVRKTHPKFVWFANGVGMNATVENPGIGPLNYKTSEMFMVEMGGGGSYLREKTGIGLWRGANGFIASLDGIHRFRESVGYYHRPECVYGGTLPYTSEVTVRGILGAYFANRHTATILSAPPALNTRARPMADYLRFAVRYGEYIYHEDIQWIPPEKQTQVTAAAPKAVQWRQYVYRRPLPGGEQTIVHFLNPPRDEGVYHAMLPPASALNTRVRLKIPAGLRLKNCVYLTPDQTPNQVKVQMTADEGSVVVTIPQIDAYGLLLAEWGKAPSVAPMVKKETN